MHDNEINELLYSKNVHKISYDSFYDTKMYLFQYFSTPEYFYKIQFLNCQPLSPELKEKQVGLLSTLEIKSERLKNTSSSRYHGNLSLYAENELRIAKRPRLELLYLPAPIVENAGRN